MNNPDIDPPIQRVVLLNAPVLTEFGLYEHRPVGVSAARELVGSHPWLSAIGHASAAHALSQLLGVKCSMNRVAVRQQPGDVAIVLRLSGRLGEGEVLDREGLERVGYTLTLIRRLS